MIGEKRIAEELDNEHEAGRKHVKMIDLDSVFQPGGLSRQFLYFYFVQILVVSELSILKKVYNFGCFCVLN